MINKDDWRLTGQEKFLKGATLQFKTYLKYRENWDHDHCEFCQAKFMEKENPNTLHKGYTTLDDYYWICPQCFDDFKVMFEWKVDRELK